MKLNKLNKIHIKVKLNSLLTAILVLVLLWEFYLAYKYILGNFTAPDEEIMPSNIVRINSESYKETVDFLNAERKFSPEPINLKRSNPFKP